MVNKKVTVCLKIETYILTS